MVTETKVNSTIFTGERGIKPRLFHLGDADLGSATGKVDARLPCSLGYIKHERPPGVDDL